MSVSILEFSAFQSIILQPLANMLHDSSEMIFQGNGDHSSPSATHTLTPGGTTTHTVKDRFKMPLCQLTLFLGICMECDFPLKTTLHSSCFDTFQKSTIKHAYMARKESHFLA